jgi:putative flippase GtrA
LSVEEYSRYLAVQATGAGVNFGLYVGLLIAIPALKTVPVVPLGAAALVAMFVNYQFSRRFVFS